MAEKIWSSLGHDQPLRRDLFTFSANPKPPTHLSFSFSYAPSPQPRQPKRPRPLNDVDGEGSGKTQKKRRLGLILITSRLSPPFSLPATYIVSRGASKIAVWAKQKALGRSLLRKAAIMNQIRRRALQLKECDPVGFEMARKAFPSKGFSVVPSTIVYLSSPDSNPNTMMAHGVMFPHGSIPIPFGTYPPEREERRHPSPFNSSFYQRWHLPSLSQPIMRPRETPSPSPSPATPRRQYIPLPPSPLSLINYDVFDDEHDYFDSNGESGDRHDDNNKDGLIYSDFNVLEPSEPVVEDHDSLSAFDSLCFWGRWARESEDLKEDGKG
ncbi:hypothetical protein VTN00DRAFT_4242 [Thermoascus crustaceus]|uniref:uncharacterized protein n=1 Tax=Thermoascus crustaceus TaxID=5088 RepID=UPI003743D5DA